MNAFIQRAYEYIGTQYIEPWSTAPVELLIALVLSCSAFMLLAWIWVLQPPLITIAGIQAKPIIP